MEYKRITILSGHYGSGKTNIAVNMATELADIKENVTVADLDIVNPYFRTKDSLDVFESKNIRLIVSEFANSNVDLPSMPDDMYSITDDKRLNVIIDVGGDERGAIALGRLAPMILEENNYDMLLVVNKYRPLTPDAESTLEIMREIEQASKIRFTGIINNSNLGAETTAKDILDSTEYANEISLLSSLPVVMTSVEKEIYPEVEGKIKNLFPMKLQKRPVD